MGSGFDGSNIVRSSLCFVSFFFMPGYMIDPNPMQTRILYENVPQTFLYKMIVPQTFFFVCIFLGPRARDQGPGTWDLGLGSWVLGPGAQVPGPGPRSRVPGPGSWVLGPGSQDAGPRTRVPSPRNPGSTGPRREKLLSDEQLVGDVFVHNFCRDGIGVDQIVPS